MRIAQLISYGVAWGKIDETNAVSKQHLHKHDRCQNLTQMLVVMSCVARAGFAQSDNVH